MHRDGASRDVLPVDPVRVGRSGESPVDGKSIMAVMMLAAGKGTVLQLETEGEQSDEAMRALVELINNYFDEGE